MRIAIVGAGFTGLTAGYELARKGHQVTLYEKEDRPGGLAAVTVVRDQRLERCYHHLFTGDADFVGLIDALGFSRQLEWLAPRNAIYANGKLYPFTTPLNLLCFSELSLAERLQLGLLVIHAQTVRDWRSLEDLTAREWIIRKAGRRVYETVWEPLLISKFDSDAADIGAAWLWNKLKLRGATRGKNFNRELLGYLRGSLGAVLNELAAQILGRGGAIKLSEPVLGLEAAASSVRVATARESTTFDKVIVTIAPELFTALVPQLSEAYRSGLAQIRYKANLCAIYELDRPLSAYYWITVAAKEFPFVAVIEHTNWAHWEGCGARAHAQTHLVYLSRYLDPGHRMYAAPDAEIGALFGTYLAKMFPGWPGRGLQPVCITRERYAQPVVGSGYARLLPPHQTPVPHVLLADMAQIYPEDRGINYAVRLGKKVAALIF